MIDRVLDCLNARFIPFYWCTKLNLLGGLDEHQILEIKNGFEKVKEVLDSCCDLPIVDKKQLKRLFGKELALKDYSFVITFFFFSFFFQALQQSP